MQRLGGSLGDGLLTASITTPAFVRYAKKNMDAGAAKAGRDASKLIMGSVIVGSIDRDSKKGKEGAREQAAMYLANKVQNIKAQPMCCERRHHFRRAQPVADAMERGGRKAMTKRCLANFFAKSVRSRNTRRVHQKIEEYRDASCTPIALQIWGDSRTGQAKLLVMQSCYFKTKHNHRVTENTEEIWFSLCPCDLRVEVLFGLPASRLCQLHVRRTS
jgi:alkanesulfonate monooxygenase SsuD/methylene tetrahydromethanopterin reductase-like flavin-dependent oxidoreductase (luciferase family)